VDGPLPCPFLPPSCEDSQLQSNSETAIFFPNHTLQGFLTIFTNGFAFEDHLAFFELSHKIEISPSLSPQVCFHLPALVSKMQTLVPRNGIEA
jgi:hypothetical protein